MADVIDWRKRCGVLLYDIVEITAKNDGQGKTIAALTAERDRAKSDVERLADFTRRAHNVIGSLVNALDKIGSRCPEQAGKVIRAGLLNDGSNLFNEADEIREWLDGE